MESSTKEEKGRHYSANTEHLRACLTEPLNDFNGESDPRDQPLLPHLLLLGRSSEITGGSRDSVYLSNLRPFGSGPEEEHRCGRWGTVLNEGK